LRTKIIGKEVYLIFEYTTGDASGQNMVTLATDRICKYIISHYPTISLRSWHIDGNLSGDKKATMLSFGICKRVKKWLLKSRSLGNFSQEILHVSPEEIHSYWQISFIGGTSKRFNRISRDILQMGLLHSFYPVVKISPASLRPLLVLPE
jgi:hydroxymethylglutaryl-CoA reductase (NADPH)